jgi:predicted phage terminase large subunit-like protein
MAPPDHHQVLSAILRSDFPSFLHKVFQTLSPGQRFVRTWAVEAIAHALEGVRRGEIKRLIINLPPRSLKSIAASVAFPAYVLGHDPRTRIISVTYANDLSRKMSNDFRAVIQSAWYRDAFPATKIGRFKDSEAEIELTARGFRLATSTGGTLTGRGGDIIIIDDPLKPIDALSEPKRSFVNQWFANTLLSRLDDKRTGAIVIAMQRVHMDDLCGFVLGQSDEWTVLNIPAIAETYETFALPRGKVHHRSPGEVLSPEREPIEVLNRLRTQLGSDLFSAQYQQAPVPPGGAMVKRHWIKRYSELPTDNIALLTLQSWDTAARGGPENDWSVCTTWQRRGEMLHLVDLWRGRLDYPGLKAKVQELAQLWTADTVLIEEAGTALGLIDELQYTVRGLTAVKPERDKVTRMSVASAKMEAGQVFFPERASWLPELEAELFAFPGSKHDDQVDSISQALNVEDPGLIWALLARSN